MDTDIDIVQEASKLVARLASNCPVSLDRPPEKLEHDSSIALLEVLLSTTAMLEAGLSIHSLGVENMDKILCHLDMCLTRGTWDAGSAPHMPPDANSTAKAIVCLSLGGSSHAGSQSAAISKFYAGSHFTTHVGDDTPSISANCNSLSALLCTARRETDEEKIAAAAQFLCDAWFNGSVQDEWNPSVEVSHLSLAQCLMNLLAPRHSGGIVNLPPSLTEYQIPVVLTEILTQCLRQQHDNGAWDQDSCDATAYSVLTLCTLQHLPWLESVSSKVKHAIVSGKEFLTRSRALWDFPRCNWFGQASPVLTYAYCIAALAPTAGAETRQWNRIPRHLNALPQASLAKWVQFFQKLPLFESTPEWILYLSLIEAQIFIPVLSKLQLGIFPYSRNIEHKWLSIIPFTWISCNNMRSSRARTQILWDMMVASILAYGADEYMEAVVAKLFAGNWDCLRSLITSSCEGGISLTKTASSLESDETNVRQVLTSYVDHFANHPSLKSKDRSTQKRLRRKISDFFLAHCQQLQDNMQLQASPRDSAISTAPIFKDGLVDYHDWVQSTSASHTSCPYSFFFYTCIASSCGQPLFPDVVQGYIMQDICRHLASMCRQQNDMGSYNRDTLEFNLNSLHFAEFETCIKSTNSDRTQNNIEAALLAKRDALKAIIRYERNCMKEALQKLGSLVEPVEMEPLYLFVDVTDLYGQIYEAKDMTSRVK